MLEKGKISSFQMAIMMYPVIVGTAIMAVPAITADFAKNDMWLSPIWASFFGFLAVYTAFQLHKLYPGQTIIQYSEQIIGRIPSKIISFIFLLFYIQVNGEDARIYADFVIGSFLNQTPIIVVISTMILISAFAVRGGIEVVARVAQLFLPLFVFSLVIILVLLLPELEIKNMFPIMENGIIPSIKAAALPQSWFAQFLLIAFFLPYLSDVEKGPKWGMIAVFTVMLTFIVTNLIILFLFGATTASHNYPLLSAARYISIADFFEHLESIIMAMWVAGVFIKFSVVYYAIVLAIAQWLKLSDYRPIVFPVGLLTVLFSFWGYPNQMVVEYYDIYVWTYYSLLVQTLLPLLLLLITILRGGKRQKRNSPS